MTLPPDLVKKSARFLDQCRGAGLHIVTAESCTGGLIAGCLTEVAGSSDVVDRGFVTYSNEAKTELVGVPPELIATDGAVSETVARAMAEGALMRARAELAIAVTGVAGPGGGTATKPVGLVHFAVARKSGETHHESRLFAGNRSSIREATVDLALDLLGQAAMAESAESDRLARG